MLFGLRYQYQQIHNTVLLLALIYIWIIIGIRIIKKFSGCWTSQGLKNRKIISLICGNERQTRCNRLVFYCKTYCLLNTFRAPLCPSSGALELYRWLLPVVVVSLVYGSLVWCAAVGYVSGLRDAALEHSPQVATTCTILLSSWWWAYWCPKHVERKISFAIKNQSVESSWPFFSTY